MTTPTEDYGRLGRIGVGVPQANPTVEPELAVLLPDQVTMHVTRLNSDAPEPRDRFMAYFYDLPETLARYDTLKLKAYGFACTASSYLLGDEEERRLVDQIESRFETEILTGGAMITSALRHLGAERIAIGAPYPAWLSEASHQYWQAAGFSVADDVRVDIGSSDTRKIYEITAQSATDHLRSLKDADCDCVVITGTGMPSLKAIDALKSEIKVPIISTNMSLAWGLCRSLGLETVLDDSGHPLIDGWQSRLCRL